MKFLVADFYKIDKIFDILTSSVDIGMQQLFSGWRVIGAKLQLPDAEL
jgi:hypothetical protein